MKPYLYLMRLHKPIGIYLLLWPTLWALFLATDGLPKLNLLFIFITGVVLMRSAGCVINDYADRDIDKLVKRTENRPITSGKINTNSALILFAFLVTLAFILVLFTNPLTIKLALIAVFLATLYPFTKRWTNLPQLILGISFSMSVLMAFSATHNQIPMSAWWLFLASVIWTVIYDTMYAMADKEEDLKINVKSTAILFGSFDRLIIAALQVCLLLVLTVISAVFNLGFFYTISLILVALIMIYHQILIKNRKKNSYFQAFLHNNYLGMIIFLGIATPVIIKTF